MRKSVVATLCFLTLTAFVPAQADPGAYAVAQQIASADWLVMTGRNSAVWYFAIGGRLVDPYEGVYVVGAVARGRCKVDRGPVWVSVSCRARAKVKDLDFEDFELDPTLASARMTLRQGGFRHRVVWRGRGRAPETFTHVGGGAIGAKASAGLIRRASGRGRLFGRKMPTRSRGRFARPGSVRVSASLWQGVQAAAYGSERTVVIEDGVAVARATFRIRR